MGEAPGLPRAKSIERRYPMMRIAWSCTPHLVAFTIDEQAPVTCHRCGATAPHIEAVAAGWRVYVFHDRHECPQCIQAKGGEKC